MLVVSFVLFSLGVGEVIWRFVLGVRSIGCSGIVFGFCVRGFEVGRGLLMFRK